jgi:hypothetical protein
LRNSGRKTAAHFSWNCFQKEKRPGAKAARPEMKVKPSEGNTVRRNGRRTPNDILYVGFDRQVCDEQNSKNWPNSEKISLTAAQPAAVSSRSA